MKEPDLGRPPDDPQTTNNPNDPDTDMADMEDALSSAPSPATLEALEKDLDDEAARTSGPHSILETVSRAGTPADPKARNRAGSPAGSYYGERRAGSPAVPQYTRHRAGSPAGHHPRAGRAGTPADTEPLSRGVAKRLRKKGLIDPTSGFFVEGPQPAGLWPTLAEATGTDTPQNPEDKGMKRPKETPEEREAKRARQQVSYAEAADRENRENLALTVMKDDDDLAPMTEEEEQYARTKMMNVILHELMTKRKHIKITRTSLLRGRLRYQCKDEESLNSLHGLIQEFTAENLPGQPRFKVLKRDDVPCEERVVVTLGPKGLQANDWMFYLKWTYDLQNHQVTILRRMKSSIVVDGKHCTTLFLNVTKKAMETFQALDWLVNVGDSEYRLRPWQESEREKMEKERREERARRLARGEPPSDSEDEGEEEEEFIKEPAAIVEGCEFRPPGYQEPGTEGSHSQGAEAMQTKDIMIWQRRERVEEEES